MSEVLSFKEYKEKYKYLRAEEVIAYELYLIIKKLDFLKEENEKKPKEPIEEEY